MPDATHALRPLVVDLDGTLIRGDLLLESMLGLLSRAPFTFLRSLTSVVDGLAALKTRIAEAQQPDIATVPLNKPLLDFLTAEKAKGRPIYLASASHESYVREVAAQVGIFTGYFGSSATLNLKGDAKAAALVEAFGARGFDYVGNETADLPVWEQAATAIVTTADRGFESYVLKKYPGAIAIPQPAAQAKHYLKAVRPHQWLKNLLILVPTFAAHQFALSNITTALLAFASFSAIASCGYIINDLLDLASDRNHHRKRNRPLASGLISPAQGIKLAALLFVIGTALGALLPAAFELALLLYFALSLTYSTVLKRKLVVDVIALALLYSLRLVAGGVATGVTLSAWLLSFSSFFFLSLALVKRCSELVARAQHGEGDPKGRDYRLSDLPMLQAMAAASGYVAALTSGLYINSTTVTDLYGNPGYLWAVPIVLLYWISRMLMLMHRGLMVDDPVLFAVRDRTSILCGLLLVFVLLLSI